MSTKVLLGFVIGIIVSLLSWNGNRNFHGVTLFPDLLTPLALLGLTCAAVWFCARRESPGIGAWQIGRSISLSAGVIFALAMTGLTISRFSTLGHRAPLLLVAFSFLIALCMALACGVIASWLTRLIIRPSR